MAQRLYHVTAEAGGAALRNSERRLDRLATWLGDKLLDAPLLPA